MNPSASSDFCVATLRAQLSREVAARHGLLEMVIQYSPAAIALVHGPGLTYEMVNPAYQALVPGEHMVGRAVEDVWPHAAPRMIPLLNSVLDTGTVHHSPELAIPPRIGFGPSDERYLDCYFIPLPPAEEARVLVVAIEITRHKHVEAELRAAYSELAAVYANAPVVLFVVDHELRVEKVNELAARFAVREVDGLTRQKPGDVFGCLNALDAANGCGTGPACGECPIRTTALDSLAHGTHHHGVEAFMPRSVNGEIERRCLLISTSVMDSGQGRKVLICAQDITELKRTQLALESALGEKTILLKEIHHRVKNNLAVICGLLSMKADTACNSETRLALEDSRQRVHSMALIHEHLYSNGRLDRINFAVYAKQLVSRLHAAVAAEPDRIAIDLDLEPFHLAIERAVPCGLILNELLTNAFKYAFRGRPGGRIAVSFRESTPGVLALTVEDDGVGLPPDYTDVPMGNSLGLRIVQILTSQLDGTLLREPCSGTRMVLRFPADSVHA
jgi:two-component sensor histidine kinase/PAS domain-containing protein